MSQFLSSKLAVPLLFCGALLSACGNPSDGGSSTSKNGSRNNSSNGNGSSSSYGNGSGSSSRNGSGSSSGNGSGSSSGNGSGSSSENGLGGSDQTSGGTYDGGLGEVQGTNQGTGDMDSGSSSSSGSEADAAVDNSSGSGSGGDAGQGMSTTTAGGSSAFPGCPNCKSIFDGMTLNGWIPSAQGGWDVKDNSIHGTGTAGRGYIYTKEDYGDFRLIFSIRHLVGGHAPCILLFGTHPPPARDALGAIQFQPPNGGTWDYRPGKNNAGGNLFMKLPHPMFNSMQWSQCEVLAHISTGEFRAACCQLTGNTPCKGVEVLSFKDPTAGGAGKTAPIGLQVHNGGLQDEYKDIYIEVNPTVNDLITTH